MRTSRWMLAAGVVIALVGCGGGDDAATVDAAVDAALPGSLTFRLAYDSDVPDSIFVQSATGFGGQGWLTVRPVGGAELAILDDCGRCNCDSCDPCAVCGVGLTEVTEIPRGGHLDWTWDTSVFGDGTCAGTGGSCERAAPLAAGAYLARFCWSFTSDGIGVGHHVGPVTCADETFTFPPAASPPPPIEHAECACG